MSRSLLVIALLVFGTGCSATRPRWSTIVVTPLGLSFRQPPREVICGDSRHWTPIAVAYPLESLIPAACTPSPVGPEEQVTFIEEDERPAAQSPSGPVPTVTTVVPAPLASVPAPALPAIVHLKDASDQQLAPLSVSNLKPDPFGGESMIQTVVDVTHRSAALSPPACAPIPVRTVELVKFVEEDESPAPPSPSGPVPSVTTAIPVPSAHVPASAPPTILHLDNEASPESVNPLVSSVAPVPSGITPIVQTASMSTLPTQLVRVESPPPTESNWKPVTTIALVSPVQTSPAIRCDQGETTLPKVRQFMPVEHLSTPVLVQADLSELLTEIRNQRQLIEALQRDLSRERSADDSAIEELEAAIENLLDHTAQHEIPITMRK